MTEPTEGTDHHRECLQRAGVLLQELRQLTLLSPSELARAAGTTAGTIRDVERGKARPRRALVERLARTLAQVVLEDLVDIADEAFAPPSSIPGEHERVEAQRDARASSTVAVRLERDIRLGLVAQDPELKEAAINLVISQPLLRAEIAARLVRGGR